VRHIAVLVLFLSLSANVSAIIHPGPADQISDRLEPFGSVCRAGSPCDPAANASSSSAAASGSASNSLSLEKVELSEGNEHTVRMLNIGPGGSMVFDPPVIKVSVGDTIHFKATDLSHNSASIQDMIPAGASAWAGALNEDVSVKLESEGVYVYQCDPHLVMAMVGVIQVGAATNLEEIKQAARTMKATFAMNAERLETYISRL
jgi:pseudoazurin